MISSRINPISEYSKIAIEVLQTQIMQHGITPFVHYELEGVFKPSFDSKRNHSCLDYEGINQELAKLSIQGHLKPEYWQHQWEFVTDFEGQSPLKTANDLQQALRLLPRIMKHYGAEEIYIKPVIWDGDHRRLSSGSQAIFSNEKKSVHIPNAIQINISASDPNGKNMIPIDGMGERLQNCLLNSSYECSLLYLPEAEAFERLNLKEKFGLNNELCSPTELSGGHQGSIALYKKIGKHNQMMGIKPLVIDAQKAPLSSIQNWQSLSRIEHRLGASSQLFNPYVNTVFALANLSDALFKNKYKQQNRECNDINKANLPTLPNSLFSKNDKDGAFEIFQQGEWFNKKINCCADEIKQSSNRSIPKNLGDLIKQAVLESYRTPIVTPGHSPKRQNHSVRLRSYNK